MRAIFSAGSQQSQCRGMPQIPFDPAALRRNVRSLIAELPLMRLPFTLTAVILCILAAASPAAGDSLYEASSARAVDKGYAAIFGPKSDSLRYDARMIRAADIALERAQPRMTWYCWRYVKNALLAAGLVDSRPSSPWAKQAGDELCAKFGFKKLAIRNPYKAPVGAVIVYGGPDAGHVEIRTEKGFVSDFFSRTAYPRPLIGVFVKQA
jgi:hypothetical protein